MTYFTATGAGSKIQTNGAKLMTFQITGATSADAGAATVKIQVSNDGVGWLDLATLTLTLGTTATTDGVALAAPWQYVRGNCTAISGTGAAVTLTIGA